MKCLFALINIFTSKFDRAMISIYKNLLGQIGRSIRDEGMTTMPKMVADVD